MPPREHGFISGADTATEERAMSSKTICLALTVGLAVASIALPIATNSAAAADRVYRAQGPGTGLYDYAGPGGVYGSGFAGPYI